MGGKNGNESEMKKKTFLDLNNLGKENNSKLVQREDSVKTNLASNRNNKENLNFDDIAERI